MKKLLFSTILALTIFPSIFYAQENKIKLKQNPLLLEPKYSSCKLEADPFLCEALLKAKELLEQQVNCEVTQEYWQEKFDGTLITEKPDRYRVTVSKGEDVFRKFKSNGELKKYTQIKPDWQSVKIYATASWYKDPHEIFSFGEFFNKQVSDSLVIYDFYLEKRLTLEHSGDFKVTKVPSSVVGKISFDKKSKLLRTIRFKHIITPKDQSKHRFSYAEEQTDYGNPVGFEESMPVPISFWSKMVASAGEVKIVVKYSDYKRFGSDIVFSEDVEYVDKIQIQPTNTHNWSLIFPIFPTHMKEGTEEDLLKTSFVENKNTSFWNTSPKSGNTHLAKDVFDYMKELTFQLVTTYASNKKINHSGCTAFLYDKKSLKSHNEYYFITNEHCVVDIDSGYLYSSKLGKLEIKNDYIFRLGEDVAVLKVVAKGEVWNSLKTGFGFKNSRFHDNIYTVGFPNGNYLESIGTVDGVFQNNKVFDYKGKHVATVSRFYGADIMSESGASGSAGFDDQLNFIGLRSSGAYLNGDNLQTSQCLGCSQVSLFIDGDTVYRILKQNGLISR